MLASGDQVAIAIYKLLTPSSNFVHGLHGKHPGNKKNVNHWQSAHDGHLWLIPQDTWMHCALIQK